MILNCLYISFGYVVDRTRDISVQFCMKTATGFITNMLSNKRKTKNVLLINANSSYKPNIALQTVT